MPARTGGKCCSFNLAKLDPYTGAILWEKLIKGRGVWPNPVVQKIEPLRGTNDVLCIVQDASNVSLAADLCRVDNQGNQVWVYSGTYSVDGPIGGSVGAERIHGSDGRYIACLLKQSKHIAGLDYSGNVVWVNVFPPLTNATGFRCVLTTPFGVQTETNDNFFTALLYDTSNGSTILSGDVFGLTHGATAPSSIDQTTGTFLMGTVGTSHTTAVIVSSDQTKQAIFGVPSGVLNVTRSRCNYGHQFVLTDLGVINPDIAGDSLYDGTAPTGPRSALWRFLTAFGTPVNNNDCDNDSTGCYFTGGYLGAGAVNAYKRDYYGSVLWGQHIPFSKANPSTSVGLCIAVSDEHYVYVGSSPV